MVWSRYELHSSTVRTRPERYEDHGLAKNARALTSSTAFIGSGEISTPDELCQRHPRIQEATLQTSQKPAGPIPYPFFCRESVY